MVVPLSDRSNKKRSENDRWPQLAASANNISLDSGKGVFICERVVDHHTPFLYFFYSPKCSELLGNSDFAKSITFGCFVPVFSVGMFRKKSISSLLEPRLEQVAQMLHYLCIVFVVVHALNRQGPIYVCRYCIMSWSERNMKRTTSRPPLDNPLLAGWREELRAL